MAASLPSADAAKYSQGLRRQIRRFAWPVLCVLWPLVSANMLAWGFGRHSYNLDAAIAMLSLIANLCLAIGLYDVWRSSDGEVRERLTWIITAFAAFVVLLPLGPLGWELGGWQLFPVLNPFADLFGFSMLTYAIVRHRVFDFGFAVNRTAIYSVTTLVLLVCFGLLEWGAEHLLQFRSREENLLVDAGVALAIFLTFHRIRDFVKEWLGHLVLRSWRRKEDQLRRDFRRLGLATQSKPMLEEVVRALESFTSGALIALYLRSSTGGFDLVHSSVPGLAQRLDENTRLVLAVREAQGIVLAEEFDGLDMFEMVLPLGGGHWPVGLTFLGAKPRQGSYRPDECKVLAEVAAKVGESLQELRLSELMRENEQLRSSLAQPHAGVPGHLSVAAGR